MKMLGVSRGKLEWETVLVVSALIGIFALAVVVVLSFCSVLVGFACWMAGVTW